MNAVSQTIGGSSGIAPPKAELLMGNEFPEAPTRSESVCLIIVTYNSASVLPGLLASIPQGMAGVDTFEVIVADNKSQDGSDTLAATHPLKPRVIRMGSNAGYAAAINAAVTLVDPNAYLLILNPDIRLGDGCVKSLLRTARQSTVGVAIPCNLRESGEIDPTIRREPSVSTVWCEAILGGAFAARLGLGEVVARPNDYNAVRSVEWATGSALLVSPTARNAVGPWDESFFLYSEEVDYQRRVREAGFDIVFVPQSRVTHVGGEYQVNPRLYALLTTNRIRYFRRNHGALATLLFRMGIAIGELVRAFRGAPNRAALACALTPLRPALSFRRDE